MIFCHKDIPLVFLLVLFNMKCNLLKHKQYKLAEHLITTNKHFISGINFVYPSSLCYREKKNPLFEDIY